MSVDDNSAAETLRDRLRMRLKSPGVNLAVIAGDCRSNSHTLETWLADASKRPNADTLSALADFLYDAGPGRHVTYDPAADRLVMPPNEPVPLGIVPDRYDPNKDPNSYEKRQAAKAKELAEHPPPKPTAEQEAASRWPARRGFA